jgi:hypothetical protein
VIIMHAYQLATPLLSAVVGATVIGAPIANALPQCTNTTPTTTQCERPGNTQINTSPGPYNSTWNGPFPEFPWWPWGFGGASIGI